MALTILPTVPFFPVTVFCFANSSQKLHDWFIGTKMYKKHLESFVQKKGMTWKTKTGIIIPVTILMGFGFFMMMRKKSFRIMYDSGNCVDLSYYLLHFRSEDNNSWQSAGGMSDSVSARAALSEATEIVKRIFRPAAEGTKEWRRTTNIVDPMVEEYEAEAQGR